MLAAIIVFATAALTVLAIGQFTEFSDAAGALALLTVLAGIARGGITVTERLRESDARAMSDELTGLGEPPPPDRAARTAGDRAGRARSRCC